MITDYHAKLFAHELSKRHSVADTEKLAGTLLDAQVDLNPHQVEAALFAFKSPLSKGAILADEVGLGKTIEAGLLLAQKWTEGKRQIIVIVPASLRKQWAQEIEEKFFLPTLILEAKNYNRMVKEGMKRPLEQDKIVICSFQFAARHKDELIVLRWDMAVIDEAHRLRNVYRPDNKIGKALKGALLNAPKVLLTATPLQNSLMELYGLVSIIDEYVFGDPKSFRDQYTRSTDDSQFDHLKSRLEPVCYRTLRRQVKEYIRYTNRIPITQEFVPTEEEQVLYDLVSDYLRRPSLQALPNSQRTMMTLIMRKLLASSTFAIAGALNSLASKLENHLRTDATLRKRIIASREGTDDIVLDFDGFTEDAEEWVDDEETAELLADGDINAIRREIEDLQKFRDLAVSIAENAKGQALLAALNAGMDKARELGSAEKAIIFTESRRTQEYLFRLLTKNGYEGKLILFNGSNADSLSKVVYQDWKEFHSGSDLVTGSRASDMRAALVEHFRERSSIMIATEAAAEGINLQFCSIVVNYDLPWNPQRIEQRIGRCHRYGQKYDVVVINFLNKNNAADQRVYQLLSEKFKLFSGVFGASDEVLGAIESGVEFVKRIVSIYQNCRTGEEIDEGFELLQAEMSSKINKTMKETRRKLLENFDADVHDRLRMNMTQSEEYMDMYERKLWALTKHELGRIATFDDNHMTFVLKETPADIQDIERAPVGGYHFSKKELDGRRYRIGHPLAQHLLHRAGERDLTGAELVFDYSEWPQKAASVEPLVGLSGTLAVQKMSVSGSDAQDHIILLGITDEGALIDQRSAIRLFDLPSKKVSDGKIETPMAIQRMIDTRREEIQKELDEQQGKWFDEEMDKLDCWAEDKRTGLKVELKELDGHIKELKRQVRHAGNLPDKIKLQKKARKVGQQRDEAWHNYDDAAKQVEVQKDRLLDKVEERLQQSISNQDLFTIRFRVI